MIGGRYESNNSDDNSGDRKADEAGSGTNASNLESRDPEPRSILEIKPWIQPKHSNSPKKEFL